MRSIVTAMTWEYWRRGWPGFLGALVYMIGVPLAAVGMVSLSLDRQGRGNALGDGFSTLPLHYAFLWMSFAGFGFAINYAQNGKKLEFPSQLFVMPAPAWLIVGCSTVQGVVTIAALFLLTSIAYKLFLGLN